MDEQVQMSAIAGGGARSPHGRERVSLQAYLDHRLGRGRPWWRQTYDVLVGPLLAPSFAGFRRFPGPARVAVNLAYLAGCYLLVSPLLP